MVDVRSRSEQWTTNKMLLISLKSVQWFEFHETDYIFALFGRLDPLRLKFHCKYFYSRISGLQLHRVCISSRLDRFIRHCHWYMPLALSAGLSLTRGSLLDSFNAQSFFAWLQAAWFWGVTDPSIRFGVKRSCVFWLRTNQWELYGKLTLNEICRHWDPIKNFLMPDSVVWAMHQTWN